MKKITLFVLAVIFFVNIISIDATQNIESILSKQENGIYEYNKLLNSMLYENGGIYPDYYAGAFIDDSGELVISITDDSTLVKSKVKIHSGNNKVKTKKVKYSYFELLQIVDILNKTHSTLIFDGILID